MSAAGSPYLARPLRTYGEAVAAIEARRVAVMAAAIVAIERQSGRRCAGDDLRAAGFAAGDIDRLRFAAAIEARRIAGDRGAPC